ncbi:MAG: DUF2169 domain-containing protein, partial [Myxococcales bacterium]|nr:DUF2169 domain-containing protein [Myxococcales bacterium]
PAASEARDAPLPSVEWAGEEVQAWDDRPEPAVVGPYPQAWWSRLERVWVADAAQETIRLDPAGGPFDLAHPRLSGRPIPDRAPLTIDGAGPPVRARLPACPARVTWILGDAACPRALAIDEVIVDLDARVVALAWRKIVQYEYVRHQERRAIVEENAEETAA